MNRGASRLSHVARRRSRGARAQAALHAVATRSDPAPAAEHGRARRRARRKGKTDGAERRRVGAAKRVRRSFAEYGFGRAKEFEQNGPQQVSESFLDNAPRNLIAAGKRYSRAIEGVLDGCNDQDFFVLNERITIGDEIAFSISGNSAPVEVRFYQAGSCDFASKQCAITRQEYPVPTPDGSTVYGGDPQQPPSDGTFIWKSTSTGGTGGGGFTTYRRVFVGVRIFGNTSCSEPYTLTVDLKRTSSTADPYP